MRATNNDYVEPINRSMKFNKETRAEIGASVSMTKLASATITTPVAYFDLTLPSGYVGFKIELMDLTLSVEDIPAFALSADGGVTFFNANDSYRSLGMFVNYNSGSVQVDAEVVSLMYVSQTSGSPFTTTIDFNPLSGQAVSLTGVTISSPSLASIDSRVNMVNAAAVVPVTGPFNYMRWVPYGNGDIDPPTSGEMFTGGSYVLWGI